MTIIGSQLASFINREPWTEQALCREVDADLFYPNPGENAKANSAKKVCAQCHVKDACLKYALKRGERLGIWGGLSPGERHRIGWATLRPGA